MKAIMLTAYIDYESFDEADRNPLAKTRLFAAPDAAGYAKALSSAIRALVEDEYGSDPLENCLSRDPNPPAEPNIKLSEIGAEREVELRAEYEAKLLHATENEKWNQQLEAFLGGAEVSIAVLGLYGDMLAEEAARYGRPPRIYELELES